LALKKKQELEEQRKMFDDKSLDWCKRKLDNSKWIGINNWNDCENWHQLTTGYNTPIDIIFSDEDIVKSYRSYEYKNKRNSEDNIKAENENN